MTSVVEHGRRRGSGKSVSPAEEASRMIQPPDLHKVTVLSKAEWLRIQDELNGVNKDKERMREAANQREALHLQSKEVVKLWSNTIAGQRQKKLEAKRIREQIEEEKKKLIDKEEAKYQEQKRKEAIEKAKTQLYYQSDRVKGLHRALLLTEVLKEREAQIELKQRIKSATKDVDKVFMDVAKARDDEALRLEQEKVLQRRLERQAVAEDLKNQIKEIELLRERQKAENKKDGEEIQRLRELFQWEQRMEEERQTEQKKSLLQAHLVGSQQHRLCSTCIFSLLLCSLYLQEHLANRDLIRAADTQKQEAEEQQRKLFLSAKQKMMKLRKDKETELFREAQMQRERIMSKLTDTQREQTVSEEQRIAKAVAERDAKQAQQQREEEEKKAAVLKAITAHREFMRREKEQRDQAALQSTRDALQAKTEADRIFSEKQQLKAQRIREDERKLQDFNATQMAEKIARAQQLRREEHEFEGKNTDLAAEEENQFQQYSQQVIRAAADAQRNVFPLCRAAREGTGGGLGPVFGGVRASYLVQDRSGAQMPKYVSGATQNIKKLNEAVDIQEAKRRLGFTWLT
ncbi:cilia- and flagella- associated protein 210 isoform X1 [Lates calcarifer]|uniref:Cilia- and flagella- associated protein 210 isoform X1 n=1 Tax=Lates calcarifer TaxID=8187 RepID=A0AAJ7V871_LATCA|nr:cilia- and flagella- associated protein 210 isoform X1 [Lates calcarifer]